MKQIINYYFWHHNEWVLLLGATDKGLAYCDIFQADEATEEENIFINWAKKHQLNPTLNEADVRSYYEQLQSFFNNNQKTFLFALDIKGTPFQQLVWQTLLTIPFGTTVSYKTIAEQIQKPTAVRAVGGAIGKNPLMVVIPCHRVIGKDGSLTGFGGGLHLKEKLLNFESE